MEEFKVGDFVEITDNARNDTGHPKYRSENSHKKGYQGYITYIDYHKTYGGALSFSVELDNSRYTGLAYLKLIRPSDFYPIF